MDTLDLAVDEFASQNPLAREIVAAKPISRDALPIRAHFLHHFAASHDSRLGHPQEVWDWYKPQIRQLYLVDQVPLPRVVAILRGRGFDASQKTYIRNFKNWGWAKNKPRTIVPTRVHPCPPTLCRPVPSSQMSHLHLVIIQQMRQLLTNESELRDWTWGPGVYSGTGGAISISNIIQGNLLVKDGNVKEGFLLIHRGFSKISTIFEKHTLCSLLDIMVHLHQYCDPQIIQYVLRHLASLSGLDHSTNGRRIQDSLIALQDLSASAELSYTDCMLDTQCLVYNDLRRQGAQKDPSLLATMAAGMAPYLSQLPWNSTDWKEFLIASLSDMRIQLRTKHGSEDRSYHTWLFIHLGKIRNICGEDSEAAFELANDISRELEQVVSQEPHLLPECWLTMAQYNWKKYSEETTSDWRYDRAKLAISFLHDYTVYRWKSDCLNHAEIHWHHKLENWQIERGQIEDAKLTAMRSKSMIEKISIIVVDDM